MNPRLALLSVCSFSLISLLTFYLSATSDIDTLSPQGCRMSWMSPSYVLQSSFNHTQTPLGNRYSLWLYREVGWESPHELNGQPVLFIPGNAGSSHQVRSIASSATRQFWERPYKVAKQFEGTRVKPLDFFAVEFNEDLSAFHGPTLESETTYTSHAITHILTLYPPHTSIIVLGHSMGGVVATSLLPHPNISAIITMSTPHTLPPARFDRRIEGVYERNGRVLREDATPILSLCGGATDLMVPSESCIIPPPSSAHGGQGQGQNQDRDVYRRTIFSSALEGSWTGVGHKEMVWCHQVRWRVARAVLELGTASTVEERGKVLDTWLRDGSSLPPGVEESNTGESGNNESSGSVWLREGEYEVGEMKDGTFVLTNPTKSGTYILPTPLTSSSSSSYSDSNSGPVKFVLYLSQGSIPPTSPHTPLPLRATVRFCTPAPDPSDNSPHTTTLRCVRLRPTSLRLIPNPKPNKTFPVPGEGSDESEGVVVFEGVLPTYNLDRGADGSGNGDRGKEREDGYVGITIEGADGRGWLVGGFVSATPLRVENVRALDPFISTIRIKLPTKSIFTQVHIPNLLLHALVVYRVVPRFDEVGGGGGCSEPLLHPLLLHTSHPESHYFPLSHPSSVNARPVLLHTHTSAPYISSSFTSSLSNSSHSSHTSASSHKSDRNEPLLTSRGINLTIYTSTQCPLEAIDIAINWWGTLGRWGVRYWSALLSWCVGVVALVGWDGWGGFGGRGADDRIGLPTLTTTLTTFTKHNLPLLTLLFLLTSFLPFPPTLWLGTSGELIFAPLAPVLLLVVVGLVGVSWGVLRVLLVLVRCVLRVMRLSGRNPTPTPSSAFIPIPPPAPPSRKTIIISMGITSLVVFLVVPWQVAFLGCWIYQIFICATAVPIPIPTSASALVSIEEEEEEEEEEMQRQRQTGDVDVIPLLATPSHEDDASPSTDYYPPTNPSLSPSRTSTTYLHQYQQLEHYNRSNEYLLLLMTWLFPLAAPVLAVWVRTLFTAGYTTPFDGDHNFMYVAPFVALLELGPLHAGLFAKRCVRGISVSWVFVLLAVVAFMFGPKRTYIVFDAASVALGIVLLVELVPPSRFRTRT
ncbi:PGAP1-domain-containing protein [Panus rudis PR-1116 ss-1]|nr:PGAP1-domain-containing protein [Panus rudis PR-1116 ss-1]